MPDHFKNMVLLHNKQITLSPAPIPPNCEKNSKSILCILEMYEKYVQTQPTTVDRSVSTKKYKSETQESLWQKVLVKSD